ncbi:MAG: dTMP kinase [Sphingomonadales bacterium]|nr:dTMP kinase [Sphingomonadales bacterium]
MTAHFITLEGGEGVGKSTQLVRLADAIRARGHDVVTTREPGGTPGAEAIRDLLMAGDEDRWSPRAEALLFAAARADHVQKLIRPALARGSWVLCDRFIDSTRAYQGGAGGVSDAEILALHMLGSGNLLPDRTLVLRLPSNESNARTNRRDGAEKDRMGARDAGYYQKVTASFEIFAASDPNRFRMIDATGSEAKVTADLLAALDDLL